MSDEPNDTDVPAEPPAELGFTDEQKAYIGRIAAQARKQGRASAEKRQQQPAGDNGIGQLVQLMTAQVAANLATTAAKPPTPQNERPVTDRGSPASQIPLVERDLVTMSESDRAALIREKGYRWYAAQLASQLKGRPITIR